jgi:transcriptional regulator of acetoin/glycerol metabolism
MSYTWRDPARVTPARLAELEARDRPEPLSGGERTAAAAAMKARIRQFARLRAAGYRIGEAAREMGISRDTARAYDRARKETDHD